MRCHLNKHKHKIQTTNKRTCEICYLRAVRHAPACHCASNAATACWVTGEPSAARCFLSCETSLSNSATRPWLCTASAASVRVYTLSERASRANEEINPRERGQVVGRGPQGKLGAQGRCLSAKLENVGGRRSPMYTLRGREGEVRFRLASGPRSRHAAFGARLRLWRTGGPRRTRARR